MTRSLRLFRSKSKMRIGLALTVAVALAAVASAAVAVADGSSAQKRAKGCPAALPHKLGDVTGALAAARVWGSRQHPRRFLVGLLSTSPYSLGTDSVWRKIARQQCGARVASRSWVAFYYAPARSKSADLAEGVVYLARTAQGWKEWYAYR